MLLEYQISKPGGLKGYPLHRMVTGLTGGQPCLLVMRVRLCFLGPRHYSMPRAGPQQP